MRVRSVAIVDVLGRRALGKSAVDANSRPALDISDVHKGLVQGGIAPVSDELVEIFLVFVVFTTTWQVLGAQALNRLRLLLVGRNIVECVFVLVWVAVGSMSPGGSSEAEGTTNQ